MTTNNYCSAPPPTTPPPIRPIQSPPFCSTSDRDALQTRKSNQYWSAS